MRSAEKPRHAFVEHLIQAFVAHRQTKRPFLTVLDSDIQFVVQAFLRDALGLLDTSYSFTSPRNSSAMNSLGSLSVDSGCGSPEPGAGKTSGNRSLKCKGTKGVG